MAFIPRQTIPGVSPEAAQALLEIQRQIAQDLDALRLGPVVTTLQRQDYSARENEYVRCAPPAEGMTILLPSSRPQNQGQSIRVLVETVLSGGGVTISVARGTINGLTTITLSSVGLVEFTSDGLGNWLSAWAPGTTGTPPGVAGTMLATQSPPGQPAGPRRPPVIPGPRGLPGKAATPAAPGRTGIDLVRQSIIPSVLPIIPRGDVLGVEVDNANTNDQAHAITRFEVGELIRRSFLTDGAGAAGTNNDFALDVRINVLRINPGSLGGDVTITGFALNGGGATNNAGGFFVLVKQGASNKIVLKNATGSAANNQLILPGSGDLNLTQENISVLIHYWGGRWQVIGAPFITASTGILMSNQGVITVDQAFSPVWTGDHTWTGFSTFNGAISINERFLQQGVISPSFGTTQNDWNPTGLATASVIRATATAGSLRITGILAQASGTRLLLINVGSNPFTIDKDSISSSAGNRILHDVDTFVIGPDDALELWYDITSAAWRCIHTTTSA